jgi:hypothetical protein
MSGTEPAKSAPGGLGWRITNSQLTALSSLKVPYKGARRGSRGRGPRIDLHMPRSPPLTNPNPDKPPPDTEGIETSGSSENSNQILILTGRRPIPRA